MINKKIAQVKFKDANNKLFTLDIEIKKTEKGDELSITGQGDGGCGQVYDKIKPLNQPQKDLLAIWRKYHLNGMNAGTEEQTKLLDSIKDGHGYDDTRRYLDSHGRDGKPLPAYEVDSINKQRTALKHNIDELKAEIDILEEKRKDNKLFMGGTWIIIKELDIKEFINHYSQAKTFFDKQVKKREFQIKKVQELLDEVNMKTMLFSLNDKKPYEYGSAWLYRPLPNNLWKKITLTIIPSIERAYEQNLKKGGEWEDITDYKIVALGKHLGLDPSEAEDDIIVQNDVYSYCGNEYYVLTENEAYDKCVEYLGDECWSMAVESGSTELGKKEWIAHVINTDGYGHILNSEDGRHFFDDDNKVYIMRV